MILSTAGQFAESQSVYAAHGIPIFPVLIESKKPAVANYQRIGLPASRRLATQPRFRDAPAFGFALGKRNGITVLDSDSTDENVFADALSRHGETPFKVRSGSGHFQAWYRHGGERRHIRPNPALPVDILGAGYVVAPPSQGRAAQYTIISGSLDDLDRLPTLQNFVASLAVDAISGEIGPIAIGRRNKSLWEHCMRHARACDDFAALLDVAETFNTQSLIPSLAGDEVEKTARSAWDKTEAGANWFGARSLTPSGAFPPAKLSCDPYLFTLLTWLRDHDGPGRSLMIADALADVLGWSVHQLRETRRRAVAGQWVTQTAPAMRSRAARFEWGPSSLNGSDRKSPVLEDGGSVYSHLWIPEAIPAGSGGQAVPS
jgi:hypothetical protein